MKKPNLKPAFKKLKGTPTFYANKNTSEILSDILKSHKKKSISFTELLKLLHEVGFAFILVFLGLLGAISPPGMTLITGLLPLLVGFQMLAGKESPWVPAWLGKKNMKVATLETIISKMLPIITKIETIMKRRLPYFSSKFAERIMGACTITCSISVIIPLPLTNFLPGLAISLMALGYLGRDGLVVLCAMIFGGLASLLGYSITIFFFISGNEILNKLIAHIFG